MVINKRKHGVSFELAQFAFADPFALMVQDRIEQGEYRWQTFGQIGNHLLLMVAHTIREEEDEHGELMEVIRIISAREVNRKERQRYEYESRPT